MINRPYSILFLVFLLAGFLVNCQPTRPSRISETPGNLATQEKIESLSKRLEALAEKFKELEKNMADVEKFSRQTRADQSVVMEDLRTEFKALRGSLDVNQHDMTQFTRRSEQIDSDLGTRVADLERQILSGGTPSIRPKETQERDTSRRGGESSAIIRYNQILRMIREKKNYDLAIRQFEEFIRDYPKSSLTDNAQYWLGEGYFAKGDFKRAVAEFQKVLDRYPNSEKRCDALLKQGFCFAELEDWKNARLFLEEVPLKCKTGNYATRARLRLQKLGDPQAPTP